jgi:arylsulfatase A-like enzyme
MPKRRPNIIVIYTDQQRWDTLGANGNELIRTPNLDRMAAEGVNFTRSYCTTPLCTPSRAAFFTGRYNHCNGSYWNGIYVPEEEQDFVGLLKEAGYRTALIGKDHCFGEERLDRIFDDMRLAHHCAFTPPRNDTQRRVNEVRGDKMQVPMAEDPFSPEQDITGRLFRTAGEFVADAGDQPFFLWLSIPDPHPPYMVCEPYASMYDPADIPPPAWEEGETDNKPYRQQLVVQWDRYGHEYPGDDIRKLIAIYWGMVTYIDDGVGGLLDRLTALGLEEDTILVFTSDHGDYMGDHRMIRKGPHLYDCLTRVPLIVHCPGRVEPRDTDAMVENIDVMPTLCDLAGVEVHESCQGRSFRRLLTGETESHRDMVHLEHGLPGTPLRPGELSEEEYASLGDSTSHHLCPTISRGPVKGVRTERWKYCYTPGDVDELYNLEEDPDELHNLADRRECAEVVQTHRRHILDWLIRTENCSA